jgi:hypothetical protein
MMREGVPSVALVHEPFRTLAGLQLQALQLPETPVLIYAQDLPSEDPPDHVAKKAREVADLITDFIVGVGR